MIRKETRYERKKQVPEMATKLYSLYMDGETEELGRVATEIIDLQKGHVPALTFKGIYFREINKNKSALTFLNHAVKIDPTDKFALVHLASVLNVFKKHKEALQRLNEADNEEEEDPQILNMKGETYLMMSRPDKAIEEFILALNIESDNKLFLFNLGKTQRLLNNFWSSVETFDKLLLLDSQNVDAVLEKAHSMILDKRYKEAYLLFSNIEKGEVTNCKFYILRSLLYEYWDFPEKAINDLQKAEELDSKNLYIRVSLIKLLYENRREEESISEFEKMKEIIENNSFSKQNEYRMNKYTEPRIKYIKELTEKATTFLGEAMNYDASVSLYHFLQRKEFLDFFNSIITHLKKAVDEDIFTTEKNIRYSLKIVEDKLNSRFMDFKMKKELEFIDKDPYIEEYKRTIFKLVFRFKESIEAARREDFCVERKVGIFELNFTPLFWKQKEFELKIKSYFEWKNFRNYIGMFLTKYDDFFTNKFWDEVIIWTRILKEDKETRERLSKLNQNKNLNEFKKKKIKDRLLIKFPKHFIKDLEKDPELMAFIDFEQLKEILIRSYYPKKHPFKLKLENIYHYFCHPEDYKSYKGTIMLRHMENIKRDHEDLKQIMLDEVLKVRGITYDSKQIFTPWAKTDLLEITIDSFVTEPFELKFEGFPVDRKIDFLIPSTNYELMVNVKIKGKVNLFRKVCFQTSDLKRDCMNYVDIYQEMQMNKTITHSEKTGTIGLYII